MSDKPHREVITIHGATVTLEQAVAPVAILGVTGAGTCSKRKELFDFEYRP